MTFQIDLPPGAAVLNVYVSEGRNGADVASATVDGHEYETTSARSSATFKLCRRLLPTGLIDSPYQVIRTTSGTVCYGGTSWHRLAGLTVSETDTAGPRITKYQPMKGEARTWLSGTPVSSSAVQPVEAPTTIPATYAAPRGLTPPEVTTSRLETPVMDGGAGAFGEDLACDLEAVEWRRGRPVRQAPSGVARSPSAGTVRAYGSVGEVTLDDMMTPNASAMPSVTEVNVLAVQTFHNRAPGAAGAAVRLSDTRLVPPTARTVMRPRMVAAGAIGAA